MVRKGVIFLLIFAIIFFFLDSLSSQYCIGFLSDTLSSLIDHHLVTLTLFLFGFGFLSPLIGVPYTIFPVACAFVYNSKLTSMTFAISYSFLLSSTAPLLGGSVAFWLGSSCLMDWANEWKAQFHWFDALETIFDEPAKSIKMQTLLRLSPLIPAAALNYMLGATKNCAYEHFALAFFLGNSPYIFPLAYIGCLFTDATDLEDNDDLSITSPVGITFAIVGAVCTVIATWVLTVYTKRKLEIIVAVKKERDSATTEGAGEGLLERKEGAEAAEDEASRSQLQQVV
jgi:uncharacterized membrane protein YdjX (TVP38/TMEM64 family)